MVRWALTVPQAQKGQGQAPTQVKVPRPTLPISHIIVLHFRFAPSAIGDTDNSTIEIHDDLPNFKAFAAKGSFFTVLQGYILHKIPWAFGRVERLGKNKVEVQGKN